MKIIFHHDGILPVLKYGGIERILYWHMLELRTQGHEVVLIGHSKSQVQQYGIELIPYEKKDFDWVKLVPKDADIIHLFYNYSPKLNIPYINTVQGNGQIGELFQKNSVFVSKKHALIHGSEKFIYNALDLREYPFKDKDLNFKNLLFLAKGSWSVKNLKHCVKAAKKTKKKLHIAGGKSWIPSKYIRSYGMVGGNEKLDIINRCDCFLFPVRWHEPFGIAIIEAMAQGLPVFGSPYGSLPEIITKEVGIICHDYNELIAYLENPPRHFNARNIRNYIEKNFSIEVHTQKYLELYREIISGKDLNASPPTYQLKTPAVSLLPF